MLNRILNNVIIDSKNLYKTQRLSHYCLLSLFLKQDLNQFKRRLLSTIATKSNSQIGDIFRTNESNPRNHSENHLSMYYTIPSEMANKLFFLGGFDKEQQNVIKTFGETSIMIRKPGIELLQYLQNADYSRPINRYILYGPIGGGKTYTLNHILHFGFNEKFLLLFCPNPTDWIRYPEETAASHHKDMRIDTPIDATVWLQQFRTHNNHLFDSLDLRASKKYIWSQREATEAGDPLTHILEHGVNRITHASDCMAVLLKEIKAHATAGKCKVLVVVEKVNSFYEKSKIQYPDRRIVDVNNITIVRAFKKLFTNDWKNGALVGCVDKKLIVPYRIFLLPTPARKKSTRHKSQDAWGPFTAKHLSDLPKDLLTNEGFRDFDPFIPIEVPVYSPKEMESCLDYYNDRKWIQRSAAKTSEGRDEIKFLSGFNPLITYEICSAL